MKLEVVEDQNNWIVRQDGEDLGRFRDQDAALADAAARLRDRAGEEDGACSFAVHYLERS